MDISSLPTIAGYNPSYIGVIDAPNMLSINDHQDIENQFNEGEKGILAFELRYIPDWYKGIALSDVDTLLKVKGVTLWKQSSFDGNTLLVYFTKASPMLAIIPLVIGAIVLAVVIIASVTVMKVSDNQRAEYESSADITKSMLAQGYTPEQIQATLLALGKSIPDSPALKLPGSSDFMSLALVLVVVIAGVILIPMFIKR